MTNNTTTELKIGTLPFAILPEELTALERFHVSQGYDVPREMINRLTEIGLIRRKSAAYFEETIFGLSVLNGDFSGRSAAHGEPSNEAQIDDYARRLAMHLWRTHYIKSSPVFELCDDTYGVLSQIDNMMAGLTSRQAGSAEQVSERDKVLAGIQCVCISANQEYTRCNGVIADWDLGFFHGQLHVLEQYCNSDKSAIAEAKDYIANLQAQAALQSAPERKALSDDELEYLVESIWMGRTKLHGGELMPQLFDFARAVLAAQASAQSTPDNGAAS